MEKKKVSTVKKGTDFRKWVADWLKERGYLVHNQPHFSKRVMIKDKETGEWKPMWVRTKIDIFGCDIIAIKDTKLLWIQTTLDPHIKRRKEELTKYFDGGQVPGIVQIWIKVEPGEINIKEIRFLPPVVTDWNLGKIIRRKFYSAEDCAYEF